MRYITLFIITYILPLSAFAEQVKYEYKNTLNNNPLTVTVTYDDSSNNIVNEPFGEGFKLIIPNAKMSIVNGENTFTTTGVKIKYFTAPFGGHLEFEATQDPFSNINQASLSLDFIDNENSMSPIVNNQNIQIEPFGGHIQLYLNDVNWFQTDWTPEGTLKKAIGSTNTCDL